MTAAPSCAELSRVSHSSSPGMVFLWRIFFLTTPRGLVDRSDLFLSTPSPRVRPSWRAGGSTDSDASSPNWTACSTIAMLTVGQAAHDGRLRASAARHVGSDRLSGSRGGPARRVRGDLHHHSRGTRCRPAHPG